MLYFIPRIKLTPALTWFIRCVEVRCFPREPHHWDTLPPDRYAYVPLVTMRLATTRYHLIGTHTCP